MQHRQKETSLLQAPVLISESPSSPTPASTASTSTRPYSGLLDTQCSVLYVPALCYSKISSAGSDCCFYSISVILSLFFPQAGPGSSILERGWSNGAAVSAREKEGGIVQGSRGGRAEYLGRPRGACLARKFGPRESCKRGKHGESAYERGKGPGGVRCSICKPRQGWTRGIPVLRGTSVLQPLTGSRFYCTSMNYFFTSHESNYHFVSEMKSFMYIFSKYSTASKHICHQESFYSVLVLCMAHCVSHV